MLLNWSKENYERHSLILNNSPMILACMLERGTAMNTWVTWETLRKTLMKGWHHQTWDLLSNMRRSCLNVTIFHPFYPLGQTGMHSENVDETLSLLKNLSDTVNTFLRTVTMIRFWENGCCTSQSTGMQWQWSLISAKTKNIWIEYFL